MLKLSCPGKLLILLSGVLLLGTAACDRDPIKTVKSSEVIPATPTKPVQQSAGSSTHSAQPDSYKLALDKADGARTISQSAQSQDDWNLVVGRWQQAIQLMRSVPASSPYRALVKPKLAEYQRSLADAKKKVAGIGGEIAFEPISVSAAPYQAPTRSVSAAEPARVAATSGVQRVFRARIKRREGGTPVIDVTFNGRRSFEMIVDTGASGTVITERMAAALGVQVIGKAKVDTASERGVEVPLALVNSISVNGAAIQGVVVAIGNSALDTGLLGHDFFGDYDVTVKRDVVEFRQR